MNNSDAYRIRDERVRTAISLKEPDRVPFMPNLSAYYIYHYGVNMYQAMKDPYLLKEPYLKFMKEMDPDLLAKPSAFPVEALETSKFTAGRWAGPYWNLPDDTPYQYLDTEYLGDDDYDEFFKDPSRFILHKLLPIKHDAFKAFETIEPYMLCDSAIFNLAAFGTDEMVKSLEALLLSAKQVREYSAKMAEVSKLGPENGYPIWGDGNAMAPFDEFADHVRGLMQACFDCISQPDEIERAVKLWGEVSIPFRVMSSKARGAKYVFMPLHCGVDNFMSRESYKKFYWPGLQKAINLTIENDMTPIVFCEGQYNTRLDIIADVPKGKVIYLFEDTDMKEAKRVLGDVACIAGGMPTQYLMNESPEKVRDKTKELIDICAPGGGFIMSNSLSLDDANQANMEAWKETLFTYGKYN